MCLSVDGKVHEANGGRQTYRIADRDILVFKVLKNPSKIGGTAPYMGSLWKFGVPRSFQNLRQSVRDYDSIEGGLHAFTTTHRANRRAMGLRKNSYFDYNTYQYTRHTYKAFPAVIPKGSRLYFGTNNDIVATDMIVYKDRRALVAARGCIGAGVKKNLISRKRK